MSKSKKPETIESGSDTPERESPPEDWLVKAEREAKAERESLAPDTEIDLKKNAGLVDLTVGAVKVGLGTAAKRTGYEGWRVDDEEAQWMKQAFGFLMKDIKSKDAPGVIAVLMLLLIFGGKFWGYMDYRKENGKPPLLQKKPKEAIAHVDHEERTVTTPPQARNTNAWWS